MTAIRPVDGFVWLAAERKWRESARHVDVMSRRALTSIIFVAIELLSIVPMTSISMQNSANNGRIETCRYALETSFNLKAISTWKFVDSTIPSQAMSVRVKLKNIVETTLWQKNSIDCSSIPPSKDKRNALTENRTPVVSTTMRNTNHCTIRAEIECRQ